MILYSYFRSSAAYRVRIVLNLKQIPYQIKTINLLEQKHKTQEYLILNPQGLVPTLLLEDGQILSQSPAIIEFLETKYPHPALLSNDLLEKTYQQSIINIIACDIHPINNSRVLKYLKHNFNCNESQINSWYANWIQEGFQAIEGYLQKFAKEEFKYAWGNQPSIVDAFLVPQVYNALRFNVSIENYPIIKKIYKNCNILEAFIKAAPENQPDKI